MSETLKLNLTKMGLIVAIMLGVSSIVGGAMISYDNAKEAKATSKANAIAIMEVRLKQEKFEGIIEERTRNIQSDVSEIKDIVNRWGPE